MKRSFSFLGIRESSIAAVGTCTIAATYGLVRLAYGLFLPDIQHELGLDPATAGYISSGSSLVYCVAAAAGFWWSRQPGLLIAAAGITAVAGVWTMASTHDVALFGLSAVLSSAGAGFASPAMVTVAQRGIRPVRVDTAQSMINAGTGPGLVTAGALALALLPAWRTAWTLVGILTVIIVSVMFVLARIAAVPGAATAHDGPRGLSPTWLAMHRRAIASAIGMGAGSSAVWTYGRSLLVDSGGQSSQGTIVAWIALGIGATAVIPTSRLIARRAPTTAWTISCLVLAATILALTLATSSAIATVIACVLFGWGFTAGTSALISWTTALSPGNAAAGTALLFIALVLGQAAGSSVLGAVITSAGYTTAFLVAVTFSALAIIPATRHTVRPAATVQEVGV
ncbi:MFS transporter [Gordonia otitidis]|nr:MFS transporter [Gordonia otitidis]